MVLAALLCDTCAYVFQAWVGYFPLSLDNEFVTKVKEIKSAIYRYNLKTMKRRKDSSVSLCCHPVVKRFMKWMCVFFLQLGVTGVSQINAEKLSSRNIPEEPRSNRIVCLYIVCFLCFSVPNQQKWWKVYFWARVHYNRNSVSGAI